MTNLDCVVGILERHREARRWDDTAVAVGVLAALGLDPMTDTHATAEAVASVEKAKAPVVEAPDAPWMADPDNAHLQAANEAAMAAIEDQPVVVEAPLPEHIVDALHVAQTPGISDADREDAVRVLLNYEAEHKPTEDGPDPQRVAAEAFAAQQKQDVKSV